jgi:hypothetical protein
MVKSGVGKYRPQLKISELTTYQTNAFSDVT